MTSRTPRPLTLLPGAPALRTALAFIAFVAGALVLGCTSGSNPATSDYVVTCVSPSSTVWAGDTAPVTVSGIVARSGGAVSGAPVLFSVDAGVIEATVTSDASGFADADYFPSFSPGPVTVLVEVWDGGDLVGDDTCSFTVAPSLALSAAPAPSEPVTLTVDPDCDVPVLLDVEVSVNVVAGAPASVPLGVAVTGYHATWRRPDGTGTPGVDVPRDVTRALAAGPTTAPTVFALMALELIEPADVPVLACDDERPLLVTLSFDVAPAQGGGSLVTEFTMTVTFRRNCQPCP